mmetsp:Transcript_15074/g.34609  ORF Transcript_15074/g.34609 Transcript_15074/m.34609 type:complete len:132 (+) Transcript_15074:442-837(+)
MERCRPPSPIERVGCALPSSSPRLPPSDVRGVRGACADEAGSDDAEGAKGVAPADEATGGPTARCGVDETGAHTTETTGKGAAGGVDGSCGVSICIRAEDDAAAAHMPMANIDAHAPMANLDLSSAQAPYA